ncbi:E3 ubiquitin-protein ligase MARCHF5 [Drosophila biarmipes]|uniref:E3 ubiquitin-protein ligase MARCHF5 n=1 Tax=Drosophila biarmipes TaxID=125945 RepID=UPI0007E67253|nr:E3 ubiquitin-protein ligase MARCHF5 [Drosophila biarmipes]
MESDLEVYYQAAGRVEGSQAELPYDLEDPDQLATPRGSGGSNQYSEVDMDRSCWICFAGEEDNRLAKWVQPCRCRGATKWVHQSCLYRWIDEKQRGNHRRSVACQQCQTEYIIVFPRMSFLAEALEWLDFTVRRTCPYVAAGMFMCCVYWTAITYGAITVIQVMGQKRGLELMESEVFLLVGLPFIPVGLVLSRLVRWEDAILKAMRSRYNFLRKLPLLHWAGEPESGDLGALSESSNSLPPLQNAPALTDPLYISRLFCGAVFLPTLATAVGNLFFRSLEDPLQRTIYGGMTYIGVKGLLKIYLRQKLYIRRRKRRIANYTDENVRIYMGGQIREAPARNAQNPQPDANDNQGAGNARQLAGYDEHYEDTSSAVTTGSEDGDPNGENLLVVGSIQVEVHTADPQD